MSKIKIQTGRENEILRTVSPELSIFPQKTANLGLGLSDFVKEMKKQLQAEKGLGIAAPQVGENLRMALVRLNSDSEKEILFVLVNPVITYKSWDGDFEVRENMTEDELEKVVLPEGAQIGEEGCLSLPKYYVNVVRANKITVEFYDGRALLKSNLKVKKASELEKLTLNLSALNARLVQHEVDHLNGILICDRVRT